MNGPAHVPHREAASSAARHWAHVGTAAAAVLAAAAWLRAPGVPYLLLLALATGGSAWLAARAWRRGAIQRGATFLRVGAPTGAALLMLGFAAGQQVTLIRLDRDWERWEAEALAAAAASMDATLASAARDLDATARQALDAPADPGEAFAALAALPAGPGERGVLLEDSAPEDLLVDTGEGPLAWAGVIRIVPDDAVGLRVLRSPFYTVLAATRTAGSRRATAMVVLDAVPPADRIAAPLAGMATWPVTAKRFEFELLDAASAAAASAADVTPVARLPLADGSVLRAIPGALVREEVELRTTEAARTRGLVLLGLLVAAFVALAWPPAGARTRLATLAVLLATVGLVPFATVSNATRLFDPSVYFAPIGGAWTASVGALLLTGGLLLLAVLTAVRALPVPRSRAVAGALVLVVAAGAPFLLRALARGIVAPRGEVPMGLWLSYQIALFLVGTAALMAVAAAGRALFARRGIGSGIGPAIALAAALAAPLLWEGPGRWPSWYPAWWMVAIVALALARRSRRTVLTTAAVAGMGATVLVWGALARERAERAVADVAGLGEVAESPVQLLERFADDLGGAPAPRSAADLLRAFVASDLAAAELPLALVAFAPDGSVRDSLMLWDTGDGAGFARAAAGAALDAGQASLTTRDAATGVRLVLAVPHDDGGVTAVVVAPESQLFPPEPYGALLGLRRAPRGDPGYVIAVHPPRLLPAGAPDTPRWERRGGDLHADWVATIGTRPVRAHVEVELRTLDALVQRGTLVLLVDLVVVLALWALSTLGNGSFSRWWRLRRRRWARSYRVRLTLVLFGFFVVPALGFSLWTSQRLQRDELQARELLVRENLRGVEPASGGEGWSTTARTGAPLFLHRGGLLRGSTDPLLAELSPAGRLLPPEVHLALERGGEVTASAVQPVAGEPVLFSYRLTTTALGPAVLAAPARSDEIALDRRRRDVGVLVLFATVVGAAAALWLSGLAAREFARPIGSLRRGAIAVARGQREPALIGEPPSEFLPVFSAFRRMDADLRASREALEAAQQRTAAVLRTVASGVVAVNRDGVISLANPAADVLFGTPVLPGMPLDQSAAAPVADRVRRFLAVGADDEEFDLALDGRQVRAGLSRLSGSDGGAVVTLDDVTEVARAERVLAWGEMARQIAHEIKNPLTPIRLGVQHLRRAYRDGRGDFGATLDQNVGRILAEIDHLDEIARAFSRYGTLPEDRPAPEPIDVGAVAHDVIALERLGEERLTWTLHLPDVPARARARGDELHEVLLNLLENARHAGASRVDVTVSAAAARVTVLVQDDGEGIPADVLPRIFEPHFSTRTSGSGLGLAISRRLVEAWGGGIAVDSTPGAGTIVTVALAAAHEG